MINKLRYIIRFMLFGPLIPFAIVASVILRLFLKWDEELSLLEKEKDNDQ